MDGDESDTIYFLVPLLLVNFASLALAMYQSYKARNLPTEFSESSYLSMAMISLIETCMIGVPILFVVGDDPTSNFLMISSLVNIACLSILLPIFLPKFINRHFQDPGGRRCRHIDMGTTSGEKYSNDSRVRGTTAPRMREDDGNDTPTSTSGTLAIVVRRQQHDKQDTKHHPYHHVQRATSSGGTHSADASCGQENIRLGSIPDVPEGENEDEDTST